MGRGESSAHEPRFVEELAMVGRRRGADRPSDAARIASLAAQAHEPVADLLREVADFRLALETDLIIAAAATDAERADLAAEAVDSSSEQLHAFQERMLDRLAAPRERRAAVEPIAPRRLRGTFAVAAAATVLAFLGGGFFQSAVDQEPATETVALSLANQQLDELRDAEESGEAREAAAGLHTAITVLLEDHAVGDPALTIKIAEILREEQRLLAAIEDEHVTADVLAKVAELVRTLKSVAPPRIRPQVAKIVSPPPAPVAPPAPKSEPKASSSPSPKASPSPSPSASASSSSSQSSSGGQSGGGNSGNGEDPTGGSLPGV